jgi:hypothetical protein
VDLLLFTKCVVKKKSVGALVKGKPTYSEVEVATDVSCRLDLDESNIKNSTELSQPGSSVEEYHGILYTKPNTDFDDTCWAELAGDTRKWEFLIIKPKADASAVHHYEIEVRTVVHR